MTTAPFKYVSGHCGNGAHEGTKALSPGGSLLTSCRGKYDYRFFSIKCGCFCHEMYDMLRATDPDALADMSDPTPVPESPSTVTLEPFDALAGLPPFTPPSPVDNPANKVYRNLLGTGNVSAQLADMVREQVFKMPAAESEEAKTGSRRKRGELEANVEVVCRMWLDGLCPWPKLTTDIVALLIDAYDPPSQGAIHAVFTRWAGSNYATIGQKPIQFLKFSDDVRENGVAFVKARSSREAKNRAKGFF